MVCPKCSIEGMWAVDLPYDAMKAGWLKVEKGADGKGAVTFLWRWASPFKVDEFAIAGNTLTFRMGAGKDKWRNFSFAARGSELDCVETITDKDGKSLGSKSFKGKRIPPVGAAPDLTRAVYGAPIDLLTGGIDAWQSKEPEAHFGWTIKDGVLSNRIQRDEKGDGFGSNANLISNPGNRLLRQAGGLPQHGGVLRTHYAEGRGREEGERVAACGCHALQAPCDGRAER